MTVKQWVAQVQMRHAFSLSSMVEKLITNAKQTTNLGVPLRLIMMEIWLNMDFVIKIVTSRMVRKISLNWKCNELIYGYLLSPIYYLSKQCTKVRNAHLFSGGGLASPFWEFKGSQKTKNVALKKLACKGTFRLIPYIHKHWNL